MKANSYIASKQVETFCPSCSSFYIGFINNASVINGKGGNKFYYATCYHCLNAEQDFEFYMIWQSLIFVKNTLSFNLSPINKFYK